MEKPVKAILNGIIVGAIIAFLAMVLYAIPLFNILILILPVPITVVGMRQGIHAGFISLAVSSILIGLLVEPFLGIIMFCLNAFVVLGLIITYRKDLEMNEAMILSAGGGLGQGPCSFYQLNPFRFIQITGSDFLELYIGL